MLSGFRYLICLSDVILIATFQIILEVTKRLVIWIILLRYCAFLQSIPQDMYIERFISLDNKGYVWKDTVYQTLTSEFKVDAITWDRLLEDYLEHFQDHCIPYPNLQTTLSALQKQNILMGVITNGYGEFQQRNIQALGIQEYFGAILISEWEGVKKPNPEIFRRALNQLGVSANESVYVGDHPINDVKASRDVGMKAVWKKNVWFNQPEDADVIIDDLYDLVGLVPNWTN